MIIGFVKKRYETEYKVVVDWEIDFFLPRLRPLTKAKSPTIAWSSVNWELEMNYSHKNEMQLFLFKYKSERRFPAIFKFGIRKRDGTTETRCILTKNFADSEGTFGTVEFILASELEERKHQLLPEGTLTISCSISHLDTLNKHQNDKHESLLGLSSDFKALYYSTNSSDMTILVGHKRYPVHKAILAARSDVFSAMFKSNMEEVKTGIIKVSDCDPKYFKDFLIYLYTGNVENFSSINVCHLCKIADKYNVQKLKNYCIQYMTENLSVTNLLDVAILANQLDETDLINLTQEFFNKNALKIIQEDDWEYFQKHNFAISNQLIIRLLEKVKIEG